MNEFESRLRDELQSAADRVTASSPLAARARRTARKIRTRRIVASGALVAAATAIAIPAALSLGDASLVTPEPAISPTVPTEQPSPEPSPEPTPDTSPGPDETTPEPAPDDDGVTTLELGDLVTGPPPEISWIDTSVLHTADGRDIPIPEGVFDVAPFGDGLVGSTSTASGDSGVAFVDADGEITTSRGLGPVISADGALIAWYDADVSQLRFGATDGGSAPDPIDVPPGQPLEPVGFTGSGALIVNVSGEFSGPWGSTGARLYDLSNGGVTDLPEALLGGMTASQSGLVFGLTEQLDFDSCSAMFTSGDEEPLWPTCEYRFHQFSPDGQYVLGEHINTDGIGASSVFLVDANTGELVRHFDAPQPGYINDTAFEEDGTVLLVYTSSESNGETAIVRCSFDGSCEAATEVRDLPEDDPALELGLFGLGLQP
jgi:hypothetical protein